MVYCFVPILASFGPSLKAGLCSKIRAQEMGEKIRNILLKSGYLDLIYPISHDKLALMYLTCLRGRCGTTVFHSPSACEISSHISR